MNEEINNSIMENPFSAPEYQDVQIPDDPLPVQSNMIDSMISNDDIPPEIRSKYWMVFNKDNVLNFLDADRKKDKLLNFDIMRSDLICTMPRRKFKFSTMLEFDVIRNVYETKLDRSMGISKSSASINERQALISQISENRNVSENDDGLVKSSFMQRLMGKKGKY